MLICIPFFSSSVPCYICWEVCGGYLLLLLFYLFVPLFTLPLHLMMNLPLPFCSYEYRRYRWLPLRFCWKYGDARPTCCHCRYRGYYCRWWLVPVPLPFGTIGRGCWRWCVPYHYSWPSWWHCRYICGITYCRYCGMESMIYVFWWPHLLFFWRGYTLILLFVLLFPWWGGTCIDDIVTCRVEMLFSCRKALYCSLQDNLFLFTLSLPIRCWCSLQLHLLVLFSDGGATCCHCHITCCSACSSEDR